MIFWKHFVKDGKVIMRTKHVFVKTFPKDLCRLLHGSSTTSAGASQAKGTMHPMMNQYTCFFSDSNEKRRTRIAVVSVQAFQDCEIYFLGKRVQSLVTHAAQFREIRRVQRLSVLVP